MLKIIVEYRNHRFTPLIYLLLVTLFLSVIQFINLLPEPEEHEISQMLFQASIVLLSASFSLLLLLLFFDSFDHESVLMFRNVTLMICVSTLGILMITASVLISSVVSEETERFSDLENLELTNSEILLFSILGITVVLVLLMVIAMVIMIFKSLRRKMNETTNHQVQKLIQKIFIGSIIMVIGPIFVGIFNFIRIGSTGLGNVLQPFVAILGLWIMIYYFLKGGIFLFQGDALRRLIIISESGIPIYSYSFRRFSLQEDILADSLSDRSSQEVLFSGAIKSISYLLSEFTGSDKVVREIILEDMVMMIKMISDGFSAILLSNKSTKFLKNALNKFGENVSSLVEEVPQGQAFNSNQIKVANELLEGSFGFGYFQQIGSK
ncbi:MAG: hypothetical protein ACXAB7_21915 [Candidatus Kariarchaeaceae archaeon]|jgi:hypothetical protein